MKNTNPILIAKEKASVYSTRQFILKPSDAGYSHYRTMLKPNAQLWKAQAWFIIRCIDCLGMKLEDFQEPTKKELIKSFNLKKGRTNGKEI